MKFTAGPVSVMALVCLLAGCSSASVDPPASAPEPAQTTTVTPAPPPSAKFSRTMFAASTLKQSTALIDQCQGPVAIQLQGDRPVLVAEHDYCGGSDWIPRLKTGDAVKLDGDGVAADTYVVTDIELAPRGISKVKDLPAGDIVLQTCISAEDLVLVALERFEPVPAV